MASTTGRFTNKTIELLRASVGLICSNPQCKKHTIFYSRESEQLVQTGQAAHIKGRLEGAARYDKKQSKEDRSHFNNGIWLCNNCAKLIDTDAIKYPVKLLEEWKKRAEDKLKKKVLGEEKKFESKVLKTEEKITTSTESCICDPNDFYIVGTIPFPSFRKPNPHPNGTLAWKTHDDMMFKFHPNTLLTRPSGNVHNREDVSRAIDQHILRWHQEHPNKKTYSIWNTRASLNLPNCNDETINKFFVEELDKRGLMLCDLMKLNHTKTDANTYQYQFHTQPKTTDTLTCFCNPDDFVGSWAGLRATSFKSNPHQFGTRAHNMHNERMCEKFDNYARN
jgi:hypothetical protein